MSSARRPQPRPKQTALEAAIERDDAHEKRTGKRQVDTSRRLIVRVYDVTGALVHTIPVPFGIVDLGGAEAVLRFGRMMVRDHHPSVRVVDEQPHTDAEDPALLVTDRGPL